MITIRKILVPMDFSNVSVPAIGYAISLAKDHNAEVLVLHAVSIKEVRENFPDRYIAPGAGMAVDGPGIAGPRLDLEDALETKKQLLRSFLGQKIGAQMLNTVKVTPLARLSGVVEGIVATAKEEQCDLIVMTSRGPSLVRSLLRDSHMESVVRKAPCPVLSIQPSAEVRTEKNERLSVRLMEQTGSAF
jgi:nucleotide-binding universal stress UspA family protein